MYYLAEVSGVFNDDHGGVLVGIGHDLFISFTIASKAIDRMSVLPSYLVCILQSFYDIA